MACDGRFAQSWQYAAFWCVSALLKRVDNSGLAAQANLTDTQVNFQEFGVAANVGMVLYNLTDGSSGPVTGVTPHTLTATLTGGTANNWDTGDQYRIVLIDAMEIAMIEHFLDIAAADVHSALASVGACDCTLASWATAYLEKLNIIDAALYYHCPCAKVKLSDDMRQMYLDWATDQFKLIRTGETEVCEGSTGSTFPSLTWADWGVTDMGQAQIIANDVDRNS